MHWSWVCRDCKEEYPEDCEGLVSEVQFVNRLVIKCPCGGMVDLCPTPREPDGRQAAVIIGQVTVPAAGKA